MSIDITDSPGALLRDARSRAGLTQEQLARRAGLTQSVISAYESDARQPSLPTLRRLVAATGFELAVHVRDSRPQRKRLTGPLGLRILRHRHRLKTLARQRGATNVRVFGSVARGTEAPDSDIDLLVDLEPTTGLLGIARLERDLAQLLGAPVDVVPAKGLKASVAHEAMSEAIPL